MWGQIGIKKALRAYLNGRPVKVVDLSADTVLSLDDDDDTLSVATIKEIVRGGTRRWDS